MGLDKVGRYIRRYMMFILVIVSVILIRTALTFAGPILVREVLDSLSVGRTANVTLLFWLFLGAFAFLSFFDVIYDLLYARFSYVLKTSENRNLYRELFKVNYGFVRRLDPTYFVTRVKESVDHVFALMGEGLAKAAISMVTISVSLYLIYWVDTRLLLLFMVLLPLSAVCYRRLNRRLLHMSSELQETCAANFKNIINVVQGFEEIKQLANHGAFAEVVGNYADSIEEKNRRIFLFARLSSRAIEFVIGLVRNGVLLFSIYLLLKGQLGFANVMFINMVLSIYFAALSDLNNTNLNMRDVRASFQFIRDEIMAHQESTAGRELRVVETVDLDVGSFGYGSKSEILRDLHLHVRAGEKLAIVGRSGCGKSTITKLCTRLYDASGVSINGVPAGEFSLDSLRRRIYVVAQHTHLFPGTLMDNVIIGLNRPDSERLRRILELPFLRDLAGLPDGFLTPVREGGSNVSGGQKQKIAVARMLMHDPEVVVFDESTSAMDSRSESEMWNSIGELLRDKTIIIISHRLSTIKDAGRIILMENGCVVSEGTYNELVSGCDEFRSIFAEQIG